VRFAKQRLQIASDYHTVYNMPEGERMIHDLLRESGVLSVSHVMPAIPARRPSMTASAPWACSFDPAAALERGRAGEAGADADCGRIA
jgi:hypothetical protein